MPEPTTRASEIPSDPNVGRIRELLAEVERLTEERDALAAGWTEMREVAGILRSVLPSKIQDQNSAILQRFFDAYHGDPAAILADHDQRMKREGAAEWCEQQAEEIRLKAKRMDARSEVAREYQNDADWLDAEALKLRAEGEER